MTNQLWALLATGLLTTVMSAAQALHWTRMDVPFLLGTVVTGDRDRARAVGFLIHFVNGFLFGLLYLAFFRAFGFAAWWLGLVMGLSHAAFVLTCVIPLLPAAHPRMHSERLGAEPTPMLEPPGFLALNYGRRTPLVTLAAHAAFGVVLGSFCRP